MDFTPSPTIRQEKLHVSSTQRFFEDLMTSQSVLSTVHNSPLAFLGFSVS